MTFLITDPTELKTAIKERWIGYSIGRVLNKNYGNRSWLVKVDLDNNVASVHCADISTEFGYIIHLDCSISLIQYKALMSAGELLERFRLSRSAKVYDDAKYLPRTALGFVKNLSEGGY